MQYKTINKRVYQNIYKTYLLRDLVLTDWETMKIQYLSLSHIQII
jgi:hypothetical protein